jgi:1-acyl-sn-glycerol-3-phosphate acyltransferase
MSRMNKEKNESDSCMKDRMKTVVLKLLGYLLTPISLITVSLLLVVFHPIQLISRHIGGYSAHKKSVDLLSLLINKSLLILGTTISFRGFEKLPQGRPIILISNHQSLLDITAITWGFRNHHPKFISKVELGKYIPSVSYNLRYGGSVLIDRQKPLQSVREIGKLGKYIERNHYTACLFPEGTRTKDGKIKPFKSAGLDALLRAAPSALVVPLAIDGNYEILKNGLYPLSLGVKVTCTVLDPIEPGAMTVDDLVMKTETLIRTALEKPGTQQPPSLTLSGR